MTFLISIRRATSGEKLTRRSTQCINLQFVRILLQSHRSLRRLSFCPCLLFLKIVRMHLLLIFEIHPPLLLTLLHLRLTRLFYFHRHAILSVLSLGLLPSKLPILSGSYLLLVRRSLTKFDRIQMPSPLASVSQSSTRRLPALAIAWSNKNLA